MGRLLGLPQRKKWFKAVERTVLLPSQEQWRVSMCSHLRGMLQAVLSTGAPPSPVRAGKSGRSPAEKVPEGVVSVPAWAPGKGLLCLQG